MGADWRPFLWACALLPCILAAEGSELIDESLDGIASRLESKELLDSAAGALGFYKQSQGKLSGSSVAPLVRQSYFA
jgi:hypothetical protein